VHKLQHKDRRRKPEERNLDSKSNISSFFCSDDKMEAEPKECEGYGCFSDLIVKFVNDSKDYTDPVKLDNNWEKSISVQQLLKITNLVGRR